MPRLAYAAFLALLVGAACTGQPGQPPTSPPVAEVSAIPNCAAVPQISAPADAYRDSPIYVANEMPVDEIREWAAGKPGFEAIWIDREHLGWVTVAFSADADARQAELKAEFPDAGAVAVGVDWTAAELDGLQQRVSAELAPLFPVVSAGLVTHGVVSIGVGVLTPERIAAVQERFAGERVCVEGLDAAEAPKPDPQTLEGDGWRPIADELKGMPYRTGIAWDDASLRGLWAEIGLVAGLPTIDFESEVVIWFGAVFGSSCPNIRLDDVVFDQARQLVHAEIVNVDAPSACTADAVPRAYLVAVERARLPAAPFAIQLGGEDPPAGVPEERTIVDAELSRPGSVAGPGEVHGDPNLPGPFFVEPGAVIEPGFAVPFRMTVHCGIEWLGTLNGVSWRTDVPAGVTDFVPEAWEAVVEGEKLELSILLRAGAEPTITATANGHSVVYRATSADPPGCD